MNELMQRSFVSVEEGKGWIIIQSVLEQSRLNTFSQRAKTQGYGESRKPYEN